MLAPAQGFQDPDGSVVVGTPVVSGDANGVLYTDSSGNLATKSTFTFTAASELLTVGAITLTPVSDGVNSLQISGASGSGIAYNLSNNAFVFSPGATATVVMQSFRLRLQSLTMLEWLNNSGGSPSSQTSDLFVGRKAAASFQLGATSSGSAINQIFGAHDTTGADKVGANFTITGGNGTGSGGGGSIIFQTAPVAASSSTANTFTTRLTIAPSGTATFTGVVYLTPISAANPSLSFTTDTNDGFGYNSTTHGLEIVTVGSATIAFLAYQTRIPSIGSLCWINASPADITAGTVDLILMRKGAASLQMGVDAATATAQTFTAHNGSGTDKAGANFSVGGGQGTGTGVGGSFIVVGASASGGSSSSLNAYAARLTITNDGLWTVVDGTTITAGSSSGLKIGTATTQKLGFFNATAVVQQTRGATLTNSVTSGGTDDTIADFTNLTVYATDAAAIRNDIYQLARILRQHDVGLRALGLLS